MLTLFFAVNALPGTFIDSDGANPEEHPGISVWQMRKHQCTSIHIKRNASQRGYCIHQE
jgi:hypothetical protein